MKEFDFSIYKGTKQFFRLFDVYIKQFEKNKEVVFDKLDINNSSYRRARNTEQNVGKEILNKLTDFYNLKIPTILEIDKLCEFANKVYKNVYYRIDCDLHADINYIQEKIENKTLLFPIYNLLKLFLIVNLNKSPKQILNEYSNLYVDIKKYKDFYTIELLEVLEILSLFFEEEYNNDGWVTDFNNPMSYQILASKFYAKEKYIETIFFSMQAREILLKDQNFKRYIIVNHTLMSSLLYASNFKECLEIAKKHMMCVKSLNLSVYEQEITKKYLYTALLGLAEYDRIINELYDEQGFSLTTLTCLLVSLHCVSKNDKYKYFLNNNIVMKELKDTKKEFINGLTYYLSHRDKKLLNKFTNYDIMGSLIPILKKI